MRDWIYAYDSVWLYLSDFSFLPLLTHVNECVKRTDFFWRFFQIFYSFLLQEQWWPFISIVHDFVWRIRKKRFFTRYVHGCTYVDCIHSLNLSNFCMAYYVCTNLPGCVYEWKSIYFFSFIRKVKGEIIWLHYVSKNMVMCFNFRS